MDTDAVGSNFHGRLNDVPLARTLITVYRSLISDLVDILGASSTSGLLLHGQRYLFPDVGVKSQCDDQYACLRERVPQIRKASDRHEHVRPVTLRCGGRCSV